MKVGGDTENYTPVNNTAANPPDVFFFGGCCSFFSPFLLLFFLALSIIGSELIPPPSTRPLPLASIDNSRCTIWRLGWTTCTYGSASRGEVIGARETASVWPPGRQADDTIWQTIFNFAVRREAVKQTSLARPLPRVSANTPTELRYYDSVATKLTRANQWAHYNKTG